MITKQELLRGYADLLDLTNGVDIGLTKLDCDVIFNPSFDDELTQYELALGVIEGKALFAGDVFYHGPNLLTAHILFQKCPRIIWAKDACSLAYKVNIEKSSGCTWNPPAPVFKHGEPVYVRDRQYEQWKKAYFKRCNIANDHQFIVSYSIWTESNDSGWSECRKLTPEELAEHDKLVNAWRE